MMVPDFQKIPFELQNRRQWVLWRVIKRDGKETKIPWSVYDKAASSTDPDTWHEFECVVMRYREGYHAGIGFVFAVGDGYAGIDLDACRNAETGAIARWAQQWIDKSNDCYCEISPSETGVKIWIRSDLTLDRGRNIKVQEEGTTPAKKPGIEIYTHGRFFAVTGRKIKDFAA